MKLSYGIIVFVFVFGIRLSRGKVVYGVFVSFSIFDKKRCARS